MRHLETLPPWAAILIAVLVMIGATMTLLGGFGIVWLAVAVLSVDMVGAARRAGRPRVRRSA